TVFKIPYKMAPIEIAVFPLAKKPELTEIAENIFNELSKSFIVEYDSSGSIGKRYLRSMVSGIPFAITVDFDSIKDRAVTVRDRDTGKQERIKINELTDSIRKRLKP
ncbi:MAG TPA: His/Gly/Thr/Pro-type tRNA ligase C-terminal domain-containing protein, partial [Candidatus Nanoarchaeia archaeon]|nr:His/Gly/Thr/Pro-type tRNA ligase C-terminal domain-containing protein [Candidatus Nanoarchaeia archaeon]